MDEADEGKVSTVLGMTYMIHDVRMDIFLYDRYSEYITCHMYHIYGYYSIIYVVYHILHSRLCD